MFVLCVFGCCSCCCCWSIDNIVVGLLVLGLLICLWSHSSLLLVTIAAAAIRPLVVGQLRPTHTMVNTYNDECTQLCCRYIIYLFTQYFNTLHCLWCKVGEKGKWPTVMSGLDPCGTRNVASDGRLKWSWTSRYSK